MQGSVNEEKWADTSEDSSLRRWAIALGTLATAAQLYLVWGFGFFPTVDGPAHVHLAYAMYEALQGDAFYGGLVELNSRFNPNMASQGLLVGLMAIAPPAIAEKLWLTLYFVTFALAAAYALHAVNRKSLCLLPLLVFCSLSLPLAFGFYNFAFSSAVFLGWFGYWWRNREAFNVRAVLGHLVLAALAYVTHVFAFIATIAAIAVTGMVSILVQVRAGQSWSRAFQTHALPPLLGSLPGLLASGYFLLFRFGSLTASGASNIQPDVLARIRAFLAGTSFTPYDGAEFIASAILAPVAVAAALVLSRKSGNAARSLPLAVCFVAFLVLYIAMPHQWIVRWMPPRFQPTVFIVLLLWLASLVPASIKLLHWKLAGVSSLLLVLLSLALRIPVFERLDNYHREYQSAAPHIEKNSSLVSIRLNNYLNGQPFPAKLDVLIQAGSRIASERHSVDLKNFQGQGEDHPIQFRPGIGATRSLGGDGAIISLSPTIDLLAYERQSGRPIDYVLLYGFRSAAMNREGLRHLDDQLDRHYRLVFTSTPTGLATLYARDPGRDVATDPQER